MAEKAAKAGEQVGEIAAASNERAKGIDQAEEMKGFVGQLAAMVGGNGTVLRQPGNVRPPRSDSHSARTLAVVKNTGKGNSLTLQRAKPTNSGKIIAMDENDFTDF